MSFQTARPQNEIANLSDIKLFTLSVTIPAGKTAGFIDVRAANDTEVEQNEYLDFVGYSFQTESTVQNIDWDHRQDSLKVFDNEWRWVAPANQGLQWAIRREDDTVYTNGGIPWGRFDAWAYGNYSGFNSVGAFAQSDHTLGWADEALVNANMTFSLNAQTGAIWRNDGLLFGGVATNGTATAAIGSNWTIVSPDDATHLVPVTWDFVVGVNVQAGSVQVGNELKINVTATGNLKYQAQLQMSLIAKKGADN